MTPRPDSDPCTDLDSQPQRDIDLDSEVDAQQHEHEQHSESQSQSRPSSQAASASASASTSASVCGQGQGQGQGQSQSQRQGQQVLDELERHFGGAKSKAAVLQALASSALLHRIPLPAPLVALAQAHKDFRRERVLLNDVAFIPDRTNEQRCHAFVMTLDVLVTRLMRPQFFADPTAPPDARLRPLPPVVDTSSFPSFETVRDLVLQRACRTSAGADSFFTVQKMLCTEGTFVTQKTLDDDPPIHIDVFLAQATPENVGMECDSRYPEQDLCSRIEVSNSFAIFDVNCVDDIMGDEDKDPKPWLDVEAIVVDESNFRRGKHWRRLHLTVTCPETGVTFSSADDPLHFHKSHPTHRISGRKVLRELTSWFTGGVSPSQHSQRVIKTEDSSSCLDEGSIVNGSRYAHRGDSDISSARSSNRN